MIFFLFYTLLNSTHGIFFPIKIIHYKVVKMAGKHTRPQIQMAPKFSPLAQNVSSENCLNVPLFFFKIVTIFF